MKSFSCIRLSATSWTAAYQAPPSMGFSRQEYWSGVPLPSLSRLTAAAAAKSLQSCPTLRDPIDGSPPDSSVPGILQARILEWVAISFSSAFMHAKSLQSCLTLCDPMYISPPLSTGFSRQEYWSGLPFPSPKIYLCPFKYDPESVS